MANTVCIKSGGDVNIANEYLTEAISTVAGIDKNKFSDMFSDELKISPFTLKGAIKIRDEMTHSLQSKKDFFLLWPPSSTTPREEMSIFPIKVDFDQGNFATCRMLKLGISLLFKL